MASAAAMGITACALALFIGGYLLLSPGPVRVPRDRRRPAHEAGPTVLASTATAATALVGRALRWRGAPGASALEQAGIRMRLQDFVFLVMVTALAAGALGLVVSGPLLAIVLALLVPVGARILLVIRASRRRTAFADQLDDSLQLMASSLRAGHSLLQAMASVSREAEEPTSEEFARVINETRVGRELGEALEETAARMGSEDFVWVTQAIAINREVGGNLAEVLDGVGETIRERNQIRRQVKALAAEGKLSAYVLMALPFGITAFLSWANPQYLARFTQSLAGYALIALSIVLLIAGGVWLRKVVSFRF
ncbi:type II secretion system F family protein [Bogoriella caseilytica]|uniref:Tight adherence protein B n=1 Tax=Bogoriella caseilytica TaxID=56055 RepID=A0A3N2BDB8_9MICO|nr:type II secretion system F family protein [Bogoriella caseilytica]ROR73247.1 tight adherence protein B [Bogoriella caseilytica]